MAPPSIPSEVTMASPRTLISPNERAMFFSGVPAWRLRNMSDQATAKPQLAGRRGAITMSEKRAVQLPSAPSLGQEAPPSARTTALAAKLVPSAKDKAPSEFHPLQCA